MNINTFYKIFYRHRFEKASLMRKIYLSFVLPYRYVLNFLYLPTKTNLDKLEKEKKDLLKKIFKFSF